MEDDDSEVVLSLGDDKSTSGGISLTSLDVLKNTKNEETNEANVEEVASEDNKLEEVASNNNKLEQATSNGKKIEHEVGTVEPEVKSIEEHGSELEQQQEDEHTEQYLQFAEILQAQMVTRTLCSYLDIRDTSMVVNMFAKNFNYIVEEKLFYVFIKVWMCSNVKIKATIRPIQNLNLIDENTSAKDIDSVPTICDDLTSVNFFESIKNLSECSYEQLLQIYLKGYEIYKPYFRKLDFSSQASGIDDFFDDKQSSMIDKTMILLNLYDFLNSMVLYANDINSNRIEKLNFIREMLINESLSKLHTDLTLLEKRNYILPLLKLNESLLLIDYYKSLNDFQQEVLKEDQAEDLFTKNENGTFDLNNENFDSFLKRMLVFFDKKCVQADTLFGTDYPMVIINYIEEVIGDDLLLWANATFADPNYLQFFDHFYNQILEKVISKIECEGTNCFGKAVLLKNCYGFMKLYFASLIQDYLTFQVTSVNEQIREKLIKFENDNIENLKKENELFYSQKVDEIKKRKEEDETSNSNTKKNKINFLRSFQHMLNIGTDAEDKKLDEELEVEFNLKRLENDIGNIKNLIDLPLCIDVIQIANKRINNIMCFLQTYSVLGVEITIEELSLHEKQCENVYSILLKDVDSLHLSKAFEKSLQLLNDYVIDTENENDSIIQPLMNFSELVNVSDIILQLLEIFYKNEIENIGKKLNTSISKKKSYDFLNHLIILKKNFEMRVDDFVANGLNAGITKLMEQIEYIYETNQSPKDYCPDESVENKVSICCLKAIDILRIHCKMISQALTNKATLEIYHQEITERLFQLILKNLKKNIINVEGGYNLINDLKHYLLFIQQDLKMKKLSVLFSTLINVGTLYTIDVVQEDSTDAADGNLSEKKKVNRNKIIGKNIAKKICDSSLYHGVFTQDEVYDLITRRIDWYNIKPFVDRGVYGLDCCIV